MIDLKSIRAAAEAATPEPWIQPGAGNMAFICMMTPATILELLDRLEAAEKDAARYRWMRSPITSYKAVTAMVNAVDSLCEEQMDEAIDALMEDEQK